MTEGQSITFFTHMSILIFRSLNRILCSFFLSRSFSSKNAKKEALLLLSFFVGIRQCPTLPGRLQPSTIGAERLNFCVRYGNRWDPFAITTGISMKGLCSPRSFLASASSIHNRSFGSWGTSAQSALFCYLRVP